MSADGLVAFLSARLADDERVARQLDPATSYAGPELYVYDDDVIVSAARALREVGAKRITIALHPQEVSEYNGRRSPGGPLVRVRNVYCGSCQCDDGIIAGAWPCLTLRALASVYDGHPDFREEWRP